MAGGHKRKKRRLNNEQVSETPKKRYPIYDYARVFAAFLVILGHCTSVGTDNYMRNCIYAFHMPFFIMVSGMLHKDLGYIPIKKYIRTLIVPYIFANLLLLLLAPLCWKAGWWVGPYDTSMSYLQRLYNHYCHQFCERTCHAKRTDLVYPHIVLV